MNKQCVLALDIGTDCIKAFLADVQPRSLHIQSHGRVDSVRLAKGELLDSSVLSEKIKQAVACTLPDTKLVPDSIIVGLSGLDLGTLAAVGTVAVKSGRITADDLFYARRAAELTIIPDTAELVHTTQIRYSIDGHVVKGNPVGCQATSLVCECMVWVASKEILKRIKAALSLANIQANYLVANIFALYKTTRLEDDSYLVLDIGANSIDFVICEHNEMTMSGVLPLGGDLVTQAIEKECELDFYHAEKLKCYFSKLDPEIFGKGIMLDCSYEAGTEKNIAFDFLSDIIHNRVSAMSELVGKVLVKEMNVKGLSNVYVVGGCVAMGLLLDSLSDEIGVPVKELDLQKIPAVYRCPDNAAGYGLLQYVQLCFAEQQAEQQRTSGREDEEAASSFVTRIRNILHL